MLHCTLHKQAMGGGEGEGLKLSCTKGTNENLEVEYGISIKL